MDHCNEVFCDNGKGLDVDKKGKGLDVKNFEKLEEDTDEKEGNRKSP